MIIEKFSSPSQSAIEKACRLAVKKGHAYVTPLHLLQALHTDGANLFKAKGLKNEMLTMKLEIKLAELPKALSGDQQTPINRDLEALFIKADDLALSMDSKKIGVKHLQLALLEDHQIFSILEESGGSKATLVDAASTTQQTDGQKVLSENGIDDEIGNYVERYTRNLTELAQQGVLDPVIGREEEVRKTIQILCRRIKNNPLLLGEPGVGKTAVVEALAQFIVAKNVPDNLRDAPILALDMGQLIAGAKYRGEFEERLKGLVDELNTIPKAILFIDEIHTLVGAGKGEGSMDAANLLKPALSRGQLTCIGATTHDEYRKFFEKDDALNRRFQLVEVPEPSPEETMTILRGIEEKYELHHGVIITDDALQSAVDLSRRYIPDRYLPDKAIDLIDQTAASVRIRLSSKPEELDQIDRRIVVLEIELHAIRNENPARVQELEKEISELREKSQQLTSAWERNREGMKAVRTAYQTLDNAKKELEEKIKEEDFSRVAELQYKIIPNAEKEVAEFGDIHPNDPAEQESAVYPEDIALTVAKITGIPVSKLVDSERDRLLDLEAALHERVVGQEEAVSAIARAIRRAKADLQDESRPLGSFLMLGPSGVGKTELAKALAEFLFTDEAAIIRIDMSEYMEKHSVSRLTGAPPGYVGFEEGGVLTNRVRQKPYSVVLFDEVEKGHPDVFNLFLQMLDDGRLTDSQGHVVSFVNTLILLTSNLGSDQIQPVETEEERLAMNSRIMEVVRGHFRPEFLNRLDDTLIFRQLTLESMRPIVDIQLKRLVKRLKAKNITLIVTDTVKDQLATWGFNPLYGARPLKRVIQARLQDALSEMVLRNQITENQTVTIDFDVDASELIFDVV